MEFPIILLNTNIYYEEYHAEETVIGHTIFYIKLPWRFYDSRVLQIADSRC